MDNLGDGFGKVLNAIVGYFSVFMVPVAVGDSQGAKPLERGTEGAPQLSLRGWVGKTNIDG